MSLKIKEEVQYTVGTVVWAQLKANNWWPAVVINPCDAGLKPLENGSKSVYVFWFGDYRVSKVYQKNVRDFKVCFVMYCDRKKTTKSWGKGLVEAIRECGHPYTVHWSDQRLMSWARTGFGAFNGFNSNNASEGISDFVAEKLQCIAEMNDSDDDEDSSDEETGKPEPKGSRKDFIREAVTAKKYDVFCLACYTEKGVVEEHPLFEGKICMKCKKRIQTAMNNCRGDDGYYYCCAVCAFRGDMIICSITSCGKVFCKNCFNYLTLPGAREKVLKKNPWSCFFCEKQAIGGLLQRRNDWKEKVSAFRVNDRKSLSASFAPKPDKQRKLRVLSLYDGIGAGFYVLENLKVDVEAYYACELDEDAINLAKPRLEDRVTHLGDLKALDATTIKNILPIDLLLGGPPCSNSPSSAHTRRKGLYDSCGTGPVFFEFFRIFMLLRAAMANKPFFWLMESSAALSETEKGEISRFLQCEPRLLDDISASRQTRSRIFWGNLLSLRGDLPVIKKEMIENSAAPLSSPAVSRLRTRVTRNNSGKQDGEENEETLKKRTNETVCVTELEEMCGFPYQYVQNEKILVTKQQELIGRACSAQLMERLFSFLRDYYATKD